MVHIHEEIPENQKGVFQVNHLAFNRTDEARLVEKLNSSGKCFISLVAEQDELIVGHVYFSPMHIELPEGESVVDAVGLGPVAVLPKYQRLGIGSALIRAGIAECKKRGADILFVLGSPNYYPRFGFMPAQKVNLSCKYPVPQDAFMVMELNPGALNGICGLAIYQPEFDEV